MPPIHERLVRLFLRRAPPVITLIIIVSFPCISQRQTSFVRGASLPASPCLGSQLSELPEADSLKVVKIGPSRDLIANWPMSKQGQLSKQCQLIGE